ncbi:MAG TPA: hypothetical protein VE091_15910 [Gemmatimonadales bacterium]|nr:hypothetical protein [Gemmatimonadales bacterium]
MTAGVLLLCLLVQGPRAVRVGPVTAVAWPAQMALAEALAREAAQPAEWPGLGRLAPDTLSLIVVPDRARLDSLAHGQAPAWGAALAFPESRTILLRADAGDLRRTLRHELGHLVLHQRVRVRVPLWFDEGYAALAAGEWERLGGLELNLAVARGAVPDFAELDGALRGSAGAADAAYGLAMSAVLELARRNPSGRLDPLLADLVEGRDFDGAVLATTGLSPTRFEDGWRRSVRTRYTLVTWFGAGGLWALAAAAAVVLVWWRRRADRGRRAALDVGWEVPEEPPDPPPAA